MQNNKLRLTPFAMKSVLALSIANVLTGCSSLNTNDAAYHKGNYRETQIELTKALEVPPNLISPVQTNVNFYNIVGKHKANPSNTIPSFSAKGLKINSNLGQSWLEVDSTDSQQVWKGVQLFLNSIGMKIKEKRPDTGFITTEFLPRKEIVPMDGQGPLTKLFNSFRTEYATGAYDRITAHVVTDKAQGKIRVYFYDSMIFTSEDAEGDTSMGNSRIEPYSPLVEAQTLYKAMIFFGASQDKALQQIEMAEHRVEIVEGTEFDGIQLKANMEESWDFFKAMVYRAGWTIAKTKENEHIAWVDVPKSARTEESLTNALAFWKDASEKSIPNQLIFTLNTAINAKKEPLNPAQTLLMVKSPEGDRPLTEAKRYYIFNQLGFIKK